MSNVKFSNKTIKIAKALAIWSFVFGLLTAITIADVNEPQPGQVIAEMQQGPVAVANVSEADEQGKAAASVSEVNEQPEAVVEPEVISKTEADVSGQPPVVFEGAGDANGVLSITFRKDMGIRDALGFLAIKYHKNIVPSAKVDGQLAFTTLSNVTFEEAMEAILGTNFRYKEQGNLIRVYTADEYKKVREDKDRRQQKSFTLYYVTATEMQLLIKPVLSPTAAVAASTAALLDTEAGKGGDSLAMHDTLVVYDFPENLEKAAQIINSVDVRPTEILLEVTMLKVVLKDETQFGIDLSSVANSTIQLGSTSGVKQAGFASAATGSTGFSAALSIDDVTGFIRALESITDTTVLANPKILALNKQAGHILIGAENGYLTTTQVNANGATQQVEFLESGTRLKFRPFICKDGYIRMEINPEQSEGSVALTGDFALPNKTTTQISTNIMVKDGRTVVIGGLFKEDTTKLYSQIPLLGDLPLIGGLFRSVHDTSTRTELIILITPHIVDAANEDGSEKNVKEIQTLEDGSRKSERTYQVAYI